MVLVSDEEMVRDAQSYLDLVKNGEVVVVTQADQPIAELKPVAAKKRELRPYGLDEGAFTVPADFDDPLPDDILDSFEGR
jgi:antitoxin (DNA-binding transcriptional repressor) of toxin-antitoxin stability system